ncbi:MAG: cellulase family glycosylhydrolase [Angelakisella sp.]
MAFVSMNKQGWLVGSDGEPFYPVGINYVASYICTNFWQDFRPEVIRSDLKTISEMGLRAVRIPMFWGYMEPEEGVYNPDIYPKFDLFLKWCREYDLYVMPWFLVGVATRDYDVPFRDGRPFFTGDMVQVAKAHIQQFVRRYCEDEQILMWDLCDEPEYYNRHPGAEQWPFNREDLKQWVLTLYEGVKEADPNHLVTLGFGHIASANFGYHVTDMADILDLMVVTCYPLGISPEPADALRNNYFLPFYVAFNRPSGNPVMTCEAPGFSSIMFSERVIGQYFRACLYGNLAEGSNGVLPWAFNDFAEEIWHECPLEEYVYEPSFGIVTNDGRVKPSGKELLQFAQVVKELQITDYYKEQARTAVIIPRDYYQNIDTAFPRAYMAYILLKSCGAAVDFVWQGKPLQDYAAAIICDSSGFTTSYWHQLQGYVKQGGHLTYFFDRPTGLSAYFNKLFGVITESPIAGEDAGFATVCEDWQGHTKGTRLAMGGGERSIRLQTTPDGATPLLAYEEGFPLLTTHAVEKGFATLVTMPLLDGLMKIKEDVFFAHLAWDVISFVMEQGGAAPTVRAESKAVELSVFCHKDNPHQKLLLLVNHQNRALSCRVTGILPEQSPVLLRFLPQGGIEKAALCQENIEFEPCQAVAIRLSEAL